MKSILRLLIVEDSEDDALLLLRALRREGYAPDYQRVDNREQIELALQNQKWDLIITDHVLPMLTSGDVIAMVKQSKINTPVIIVSGYITDEKAVAAMKSGAQDYIMKDNLSRLVPAIERELNDARSRDARMRAEDALRFIAHHDTLTSLVNRSELERRLLSAIESAKLFNYPHVFLYIDLDQFKVINDTSGHIAGDEMIKQLAHRLKSMMRESDTLARIGGDEFGILLENCGANAATKISEELLQAIHDYRFEWQGKPYRVTASIGFVAIDRECKNIESVLSAADVACYTAKDQGGNRIKVYHQDDQLMAKRYGEMQWVSTINQALESNLFCLFKQVIQPLYPVEPLNVHEANHRQNLSSRSFSRLNEFLLRLKDPELDETLSPEDFIPAAERYNLMPKIDRWVVSHAFEYIKAEIDKGDHNEDDLYFINLSGATLSDASFYQFLHEQLKEHEVPASCVCFEVTETAAIEHLSDAVGFIDKVRQEGCLFALDDFGSGMSSFTYLKTIPADFIKIDGTFVSSMESEPMDSAIVEAINHIGHLAGKRTIAEFVESPATMQQLRDIKVDFVQGFAIGMPGPIAVTVEA